MNKEFTYLNEIAYWLMGKTDFTHAEYNLSGEQDIQVKHTVLVKK